MTMYVKALEPITASFSAEDGSEFHLDQRAEYKILPLWAAQLPGFGRLWADNEVQVATDTAFTQIVTSIPADELIAGGVVWLNVKQFGTDDAAFENAKNVAGVGGLVYVPSGPYEVSGIELDISHQVWEFSPDARMKLPDGATNGAVITVTADYVTVDNGDWDGNRDNVTTQLYQSTITVEAAHCTVRNVRVHDPQGFGILFFPATTTSTIDGSLAENCTVVDFGASAGIGMDCFTFGPSTVSSSNLRISGCTVIQTIDGTAGQTGIYMVGSTTDFIQGGVIEGCYVSITGVPAGGAFTEGIHPRYVTGMQITGCYVNGCRLPYTCDTVNNLSITGCTSVNSQEFGIEIGGTCNHVSITGNTIDGNNTVLAAILADNTPNNDVTITGNTITRVIRGLSVQTAGKNWAVSGNTINATDIGMEIYGAAQQGVATPPTNVTVEGNTIVMEPGGTSGFYCGIYFDPVESGARAWLIRNNNLVGWATRGIRLESGSAVTASNVTIQGNTYTGINTIMDLVNVTLDNTCRTENWGIDTVASAAGTITLPPTSDTLQLTGTATVTGITAAYPGRRVMLIATSTAGLATGGNLKLSTAFTATANDTITLVCDGTNWYETGRSVN